MFKGMGDMFKQASEMKAKMAEIQEELAKKQVEASTGGGMVKITANGNNEILHVHIDEELINMADRLCMVTRCFGRYLTMPILINITIF